MRKYDFTEETRDFYGVVLHRIKAVRDFGDVKAGDLGGWIEKEENLSHEGNAWVADSAVVRENAVVKGDAVVGGHAIVRGNAVVRGNAYVEDNAVVGGDAVVRGNAYVEGRAVIDDNAYVGGYTTIGGHAIVVGRTVVRYNAVIEGNAIVGDNAVIEGRAVVRGNAIVRGNAVIETTRDYITAGPMGSRDDTVTAYRTAEGIRITCDCFYGSVSEFEKKVRETHGDNEYAKEYLAFVELLKARFGEECGK